MKEKQACRAIAGISGVGVVTPMAAIGTMRREGVQLRPGFFCCLAWTCTDGGYIAVMGACHCGAEFGSDELFSTIAGQTKKDREVR
jgi:hypothetical protein